MIFLQNYKKIQNKLQWPSKTNQTTEISILGVGRLLVIEVSGHSNEGVYLSCIDVVGIS